MAKIEAKCPECGGLYGTHANCSSSDDQAQKPKDPGRCPHGVLRMSEANARIKDLEDEVEALKGTYDDVKIKYVRTEEREQKLVAENLELKEKLNAKS